MSTPSDPIDTFIHAMVELGSDPPGASTVTTVMSTDEVLVAMLTENTGRHMLDSGGAYGRAWERNQGVDFAAAEPVSLSFRSGYIEVTLDVFHFLSECLTYEAEMDAEFGEFAELVENADESWLANMEAFPQWHADAHDLGEATGLYGDGKPFTVNTYNGEDLLSQTLQYTYWSTGERGDRTEYVALQIHGGCDVRGGYTRPRIFSTDFDSTFPSLLDNARASIFCQGVPDPSPILPGMPEPDRNHNWSTDDGNNWYYDGVCGRDYNDKQLDNFEIVEADEVATGQITVTPDGKGHCPICGGLLTAGY